MKTGSSNVTSTIPIGNGAQYSGDSDSDGQARGGRKMMQYGASSRLPTSSGLSQPAGKFFPLSTFPCSSCPQVKHRQLTVPTYLT